MRFSPAVVGLLLSSGAWGFPGMQRTRDVPPPQEGGLPLAGGAAGHPDDFGREKATVRVRVRLPDGKPARDLPVSLVVSVHGEVKERMNARTDPQGRATWTGVPRGSHAQYAAVAPYAGVNYYAQVEIPAGGTEADTEIEVAPTTRDAQDLRVSRLHLILDPGPDGVRVTEVVVLRNDGKRTYVGKPLSFPLFAGARDFKGEAAPPGTYTLTGSTLSYRSYVRPGDSQLRYGYWVPMRGTFQRRLVLPVDRLFVVVTRPDFVLTGSVFESVRTLTRGEASFLSGQGGPIAAGSSFAFEIQQGAPRGGETERASGRSPEAMGKPAELVKDWRVVLRWLVPLFAMGIFFFGVYLAGRREEAGLALVEEAALERERDRLLAELARARRLAAKGEKRVARREEALIRRLAEVYRRKDELASRRAPGPTLTEDGNAAR
jgi:hypothetical protein